MKKQNDITMILPHLEAEDAGAVTLAAGLTSEQMSAAYFDHGALVEPPYKLYQLNGHGRRYYYRFNESGEPEFYPSVTTVLAATLPTPQHLIEWIAGKGVEAAERYKMERARYGTFMHAQFEELLIARRYDLDELPARLAAYIDRENLPRDFINYADDLKKDVLAFAQFVIDYDVKPLAVEVSLVHPIDRVAGMIDLVCSIRAKYQSDEGGRIMAIVDFKSGRKGFTEEHAMQVGIYRALWNYNFPAHPIERIFNFAPNDWRKSPTYKLKEQTREPMLAAIPHVLEMYHIRTASRDDTFTVAEGVISLDACDLSEAVTTLTLAELVKNAPRDLEGVNVAEL